jgi:hypothetical protein
MKATDDINYDMTHDHAGNGWAIVQDCGDNYWRVVAITRDGVDTRHAMMAWGKKLKRTALPEVANGPLLERPLTGKVLAAADALRADLREGRKRVVEQRIVDVEEAA